MIWLLNPKTTRWQLRKGWPEEARHPSAWPVGTAGAADVGLGKGAKGTNGTKGTRNQSDHVVVATETRP